MASFSKALGGAFRQIVAPLIGAVVVSYFAYYTVEGDRGLVRLGNLQKEVAEADGALRDLLGERETLERRARLLRPDNLDPDMLDERARQLLNAAHPDDLVIFLPNKAAEAPSLPAAPLTR